MLDLRVPACGRPYLAAVARTTWPRLCKNSRYLAVGVGELWLADPAAKTLTRARPASDDEELSAQETLTTSS